MDSTVFNVQFTISLLVYGLLGKWFLLPWLDSLTKQRAVLVCLLPQAFRHLGLYALVAEAYLQFPASWAKATAYGDLATQLTSLGALALLHRGSPAALPAAWLCTIVGILDYSVSTYLTVTTQPPIHSLYSAWFLPVFFLPLLLWSHVYVVWLLLRKSA